MRDNNLPPEYSEEQKLNKRSPFIVERPFQVVKPLTGEEKLKAEWSRHLREEHATTGGVVKEFVIDGKPKLFHVLNTTSTLIRFGETHQNILALNDEFPPRLVHIAVKVLYDMKSGAAQFIAELKPIDPPNAREMQKETERVIGDILGKGGEK